MAKLERFVFGPLVFEVLVLRRSKNSIQYGVRVFLIGEDSQFTVQFPFDKGFSSRFIARKVLRDLKKAVDQPDDPLLPEMWSWAAERPYSILEAAKAEKIS
jgi:hypothetical protein